MAETLYDLAIIGAGPGGYVAALKAAKAGLKTACIEKEPLLGGTCLRVGCIPSKTLLQSSEHYYHMKTQAELFGLTFQELSYNFETMQLKKEEVVKGLCDSVASQFKSLKVARYEGMASFENENTITIQSKDKKESIRAKNIIVASGSYPIELPFLPFDEKRIVSSTGALSLESVPKKLTVIGAGIIGVELASVYQRLGSEVTLIEMLDYIAPGMDGQISRQLLQSLKKQGLRFLLGAKVTSGKASEKGVKVEFEVEGKKEELESDIVLVAIGRKPLLKPLNLEKAKVKLNERGQIEVDGFFRTSTPSIFAIGDVIDGPSLAHKASEEGVAVVDFILGHPTPMRYISIPNVVYTHPEAASVGFTEEELKKLSIKYLSGQSFFKGNARARAAFDTEGFIKVLGDEKTGRLLGIHILGPQASEMISAGVIALIKNMTLEELGLACIAHPTLSETLKEAAVNALSKK